MNKLEIKKSRSVSQKQATASDIKIEAVETINSSSCSSARRCDEQLMVNADNLKNTGGAVKIRYMICSNFSDCSYFNSCVN